MPSAYSFESDLTFTDAVKTFAAMEDWVRKPNLDGRWLVRDNDRLGDYLSYYEYQEGDCSIVKSICLYFDTRPRQVTFDVARNPKVRAGTGDLRSAWRNHQAYVLDVLLPSIGARNVKQSDFEK
jgi:hypothetical protein